MLATIFVAGGSDALRDPSSKVDAAEPVAQAIAQRIPALDAKTSTLVKLNGALQVVAGTMLGLGKFRRLSALALAGSLIPTTVAGHRFWDEEDDVARARQRTHFLKNVGLLGGLILAAADTEGAPSLGWRARRVARRIGNDSERVGAGAGHLGSAVAGGLDDLGSKVGHLGGAVASGIGSAVASGIGAATASSADVASRVGGTAHDATANLTAGATKASRRARAVAGRAGRQARIAAHHADASARRTNIAAKSAGRRAKGALSARLER